MSRLFAAHHFAALLGVALGAGIVAGGCGSPPNDNLIESLGGEADGVPIGEFHRAGQPCVACHGDYEADEPIMAVGGTVFATPSNPVPVEGAVVTLTDSAGEVVQKTTNCVGNFFITAEEWQPAYPLRAEVECPVPGSDVRRRVVMGTRIGRDGSCATCHYGPPSQTSPGWIYCAETMPEPPYTVSAECPVGAAQ